MMKLLSIPQPMFLGLLLCVLVSMISSAPAQNLVRLKSGEEIRGLVLELEPGGAVTVAPRDAWDPVEVSLAEVDSITTDAESGSVPLAFARVPGLQWGDHLKKVAFVYQDHAGFQIKTLTGGTEFVSCTDTLFGQQMSLDLFLSDGRFNHARAGMELPLAESIPEFTRVEEALTRRLGPALANIRGELTEESLLVTAHYVMNREIQLRDGGSVLIGHHCASPDRRSGIVYHMISWRYYPDLEQ